MSRPSSPRRTSPHAGIALVLGGLALASCAGGTGQLTTGSTPNADGSISAKKVANTDIDCPAMMVRNGASTWQVPTGANSTTLRYQGSLGQLARECAVLGESMTIKVGTEGRVLVGPKGGAGNLTVPLRIALVQEGPQPKTIWTKFYSIPVTVQQGQTQVTFTQVEDDVTFAIPASKDISNYVIYVGYDPVTAASGAKTAKKKPAPAEPKMAARPKTKSKAPPTASAPVEQMAPTTAQPTFAPAPGSRGGFAPPPPAGQFAPPPQPAGGSNG